MKAHYTTANSQLSFELEGQTVKDLFEQISHVQEIFGQEKCTLCKNTTDFKYVVRTVEDNKFYELSCGHCKARLAFGQNKKGQTLFPRRFNSKTKQKIGQEGWFRWNEQIPKEDEE